MAPDPPGFPRRKPGATGTPVRLADGREWLLARPTFRPLGASLTHPPVDPLLDRIFDDLASCDGVSLHDMRAAAGILLATNYELDCEGIARLLDVAPGEAARGLAEGVRDVLFGPEDRPRTYTRWVRASLLANGLDGAEIAAPDLADVLAVLVATGRTIPIGQFVDACRAAQERSTLEALV